MTNFQMKLIIINVFFIEKKATDLSGFFYLRDLKKITGLDAN